MEDTRLMIGYAIWVIIVGLVLGFFSYFSKKNKKLGSLLFFVMVPTWIIAAIIKGVENKYFENSDELFSARGFTMLLSDTLPMIILIGGITFTIKYLKFRKNK
jgi:hypothetical protein